jgi:tRNA(fMet)-specific endonuclease VapC
MEPRFMLDTDICVYIHKRKPTSVLERLSELRHGEAVLSSITMGELMYGAAKSSQREAVLTRLAELESIVSVIPLTKAAASEYGAIGASLEASGTPIGNNDLWIAAHAKALGLTLVTNNEKEFRRVRGLKIQNWVA